MKPTDGLEEEIAAIKNNNHRIWYNYSTGTNGVIFIKMLDCFKGLIDIQALVEYIVT